jgi:beta-phosphoglucomutase-like phosphatase (HAD superfamily)
MKQKESGQTVTRKKYDALLFDLNGVLTDTDIAPALDPASSEFFDSSKGKYVFKKSDNGERPSEQMVEF